MYLPNENRNWERFSGSKILMKHRKNDWFLSCSLNCVFKLEIITECNNENW